MSHRDSLIKKNRELSRPMDLMNVGFVGTAGSGGSGGAVGGWVELGRTTLGVAGKTITVSSLPNKRYYRVLVNTLQAGANNTVLRFNSDAGIKYSMRHSNNGGADGTWTSQTGIDHSTSGGSTDRFLTYYVSNLATKEKLVIAHNVEPSTAGAGTAPTRVEGVSKWANTGTVINTMSITNGGAGNYQTGSQVVVLGWDPADTHTTNFWEELASVEGDGTSSNINTGTFTPKKYMWVQVYAAVATGSANYGLRVGNGTIDSGSNYAFRYNDNGGTDGTATSTFMNQCQMTGNNFGNFFIINNAANEKLSICHHTYESAVGAGTAPSRGEQVGKWANTSNQINIVGISEQSGGSKNFVSPTIVKVWGSN